MASTSQERCVQEIRTFHAAVLGDHSQISADKRMLEVRKLVSIYYPLHAKPIGYVFLFDGGENLMRRTVHGHALFNCPVKQLGVIWYFSSLPILICLENPYLSSYISTETGQFHPTVIVDLHNGYYHPWDSRAMKILPSTGHSSIKSSQDGSKSHKSTGSLSIRNSASIQSN